MNIKRFTLLISIFSVFLLNIARCQNSDTKLISLLNRGRFFEAKELYEKVGDTISTNIDLYYKFRMGEFLNKEKSATIELEKTLANYPSMFGDETIDIYAFLFNKYIKFRDYEKGMYTYNRMKNYLESNPYGMTENEITTRKRNIEDGLLYLKEVIKQPSVIIRRKIGNSSLTLEHNSMLSFEAKYNGVPLTTILDTGSDSYLIIKKGIADKIGLKMKDTFKETKGYLNEMEVTGEIAILDSVEIGNITLYNIPTLVYEFDLVSNLPDSIKNDSSTMKRFNTVNKDLMNPIIGLPSMLLIGKIEIDWKHSKMYFPTGDLNMCQKENNIFLFMDKLYTRIKINDIPFTGLLDSGSESYIDIDTLFYHRYQDKIPIDSMGVKETINITSIHKVRTNIPYNIVDNPVLLFNYGPLVNSNRKDNVLVYPMHSTYPISDGVVGCDFVKRIGRKVLLDLDNMRLEAVE